MTETDGACGEEFTHIAETTLEQAIADLEGAIDAYVRGEPSLRPPRTGRSPANRSLAGDGPPGSVGIGTPEPSRTRSGRCFPHQWAAAAARVPHAAEQHAVWLQPPDLRQHTSEHLT